MQDLLVCACAVQCTDGTFCNRFVTRTPVITHIYIYTLFLYVCQSVPRVYLLSILATYSSVRAGVSTSMHYCGVPNDPAGV